jgi:hypothetical protein
VEKAAVMGDVDIQRELFLTVCLLFDGSHSVSCAGFALFLAADI